MNKIHVEVSVIIAFFNTEQYIEETIQSVINQKYTSWELILIDDGSIDNSSKLALKYASLYPGKIKYLEHNRHINKGLSASRNKGIQNAIGKWIAFLDADDLWEPEYLGMQIQIINKTNAAMVCEATKYWYSWANKGIPDKIINIGVEQDKIYQPLDLNKLLYPLGIGDAPCMCGILIEKEVLYKYNGFDESFTGMYEDQVFLSKIYLQEQVYISSICNNLYRQRPDSMMSTSHKKGEYKLIRGRFLFWLQKYLENNKITDKEIWSLLNKALLPYKYFFIYNLLLIHKKVKYKLIQYIKRLN